MAILYLGNGEKEGIYGLTVDMQVHSFISRFLLSRL